MKLQNIEIYYESSNTADNLENVVSYMLEHKTAFKKDIAKIRLALKNNWLSVSLLDAGGRIIANCAI